MRAANRPKGQKKQIIIDHSHTVAIMASGKMTSDKALLYFRNHKPYCCDYNGWEKENCDESIK